MYTVEITIEFDDKPTRADVYSYLQANANDQQRLRYDLTDDDGQTILDAQG